MNMNIKRAHRYRCCGTDIRGNPRRHLRSSAGLASGLSSRFSFGILSSRLLWLGQRLARSWPDRRRCARLLRNGSDASRRPVR
jgi:hypothetical protein